LGVLPPGDVRQCLVALSDSSEMMRKLMNYRFENGGLCGHSFGNLLLSALEKINGNFSRGVEEAAKILDVEGEVIPVTDADVKLCMELKNGKILKGEEEINHSRDIQKIGIKKNYLKPSARANRTAVRRILEADLIIIGPGNHYCSIIPNLLVNGISEAIKKSKAKVVYNCNLVNKLKHTENFTLDDYVDSINMYLGSPRIDFVVFNTQRPNEKLIKKYANKKELLVELRENDRKARSYQIIKTRMLNEQQPNYSKADAIASQRAFIRHDNEKLAKVLMGILKK
jgi:uncharacterized cofD-like protein